MAIALPADDAAPYTYTQPIRDAIDRVNQLTDDADARSPKRIPTAALGSGAANSTTFLRGDRTFAVPPTGGTAGAVVFSADTSGATSVSTALVTQATTAAGAGVPLVVPPGNYRVDTPPTLPSNTCIWAPAGALFFGAIDGGGIFSVGSNNTIIGVTLQNTSEPNGNAASVQANALDVLFDRVTFIAGSICLHVNQAGIRNLTVRSCRFQDTYFGVLTNTGANDIIGVNVEGCFFTNVLGDGVEFNHPSASAPACRGFRVMNCEIEGPGGTGGTVNTGFGIGAAGCADLTITGNTIRSILREGIHIEDGCRNVTITGNTVRDLPASGTNRSGIAVYGVGTDHVTITGNTVTDIAGIGIESVYSGGADLVSNMTVTGNIIANCTSHGIDVGADGNAGESWILSHNVIRSCDYGIVMRGTHRWSAAQGNVIDGCNYGIGAGDFGHIRAVRGNVIMNSVVSDYDGFGAYNGRVDLADRIAMTSATSTGTTMVIPLLRIGVRAEGTIALHYATSDGTRVIDSLWRLRWTGTALQCARVSASNIVANDTNLSVIDGVLSANLSGVVNGTAMSGVAQVEGLMTETSETLSGTIAGTALT